VSGDLSALYQHVILDHNRRPRNFRELPGAQRAAGDNPLCGDRITVYARLAGDVVADVSFRGAGCAICMASASLMTEAVRGRTAGEIDSLRRSVEALVGAAPGEATGDLGSLSALSGVRQFPVRVRCALLPWTTLDAAVHDRRDPVSTE
jgi:nitrogen fixation NifU-like protein